MHEAALSRNWEEMLSLDDYAQRILASRTNFCQRSSITNGHQLKTNVCPLGFHSRLTDIYLLVNEYVNACPLGSILQNGRGAIVG